MSGTIADFDVLMPIEGIGNVGGGDAGIVTRHKAVSVGELDFELAQGLWPAVLPIDLDPLAQAYESRVARSLGAVGAETRRIDPGQCHSHGLAQAELALQAVDRSRDVADPLAACVEPQGDAGDSLGGQPMLLAQPAGAFDRRMRQIARGMVFEEVGEDMKPGLGRRQRRFRRKIGTVRRGKPLDAFEQIGPARKSARREARRQQPVLRRLAGVERLAHCPELRFEPGRLGPGDAERRRRGLSVKPEQPDAGRRRAKAADGRG